jgi:peptidoglycan/LPS O-acetylase OafA/YrhL
MMGPDANKFRYLPELDGLRGIAILLVIAVHARIPFAPGGFIGVDLFFVLSGYLITNLLLKEHQSTGEINLKRFYWRRCIRLFPALLTLLVICLLAGALFADKKIVRDVVIVFFYGTSWTRALYGFPSDWLGHTWSLSIEEQFYFIWPLLLCRLKSLSAKSTFYALAMVIAAVVFYRYLLLLHGVKTDRLFFCFDTRIDALVVGCLMAFMLNSNPDYLKRPVSNAIIRILAMSGTTYMAYMLLCYDDKMTGFWTYGLLLVALSSSFIVLYTISFPHGFFSTLLKVKGLVYTGKISYGLYIWHWPIFNYLHAHSGLNRNSKILIGIILSYLISTLSYFIIERPLLKHKNLFGSKDISVPQIIMINA